MITEKRILFIVPARLGDALFCTPAIKLLKKHNPNAVIDILATSALSASIFQYNPVVNLIRMLPQQNECKQLAENYDLVISRSHHNEELSQVISALNLKTLYSPVDDLHVHQAEQALRFMQSQLDCALEDNDRQFQLHPQAEHFQKIAELLSQEQVDLQREILIGLHLGCHGLSKSSRWKIWKSPTHLKVWPLPNFLALAKQLQQEDSRIRFVITGSKGEELLGEKFCRRIPRTINLINKTSVLELAALMKTLTLFICGDTGPMHVACATDVALIALFGPTNLQHAKPYPAKPNRLVIHQPKIKDIAVSTVYQAVKNFI